ncbi:transcriptional regulator domain-containing protein [Bradyrhizobium ottawaense]|uniref:transcriptional regulator domain-containing protein n=1 Tax=Bradyrhizobium ottawaense TaxID=931866 RepID=UPI0015CF5397|nr:DUF6499 domain-containing protein [Bradyrhizobium ottawaense]
MPDTDWRSEEAYSGLKKADAADLAWEWLRRDRDSKRIISGYLAANIQALRRASSGASGGSRFPADPQKTFDKQAVFWAPEVLPTVLAVRATSRIAPKTYQLDFDNLPGSELRCAPDGWHAIVPLEGTKHRLWLRELPASGYAVLVDLPLDGDFELRLGGRTSILARP